MEEQFICIKDKIVTTKDISMISKVNSKLYLYFISDRFTDFNFDTEEECKEEFEKLKRILCYPPVKG